MNRTRRRRAKFRRAMAPSTPSRLMFEGGPEYGRHPLMFEAFCRGWVTIDSFCGCGLSCPLPTPVTRQAIDPKESLTEHIADRLITLANDNLPRAQSLSKEKIR